MLRIEKLSLTNASDITELIYEFQLDHYHRFGKYYALIPHADKKIKEIITNSINKRNMCVYVAYLEDKPVGYIFLKLDTSVPIYDISTYGYISGLYIKPSGRKQGIAKSLLENAIIWFKKKGVKRVELKANVENDTAMEFWEKSGFISQQILMIKEI